jgi:hypothetical protein
MAAGKLARCVERGGAALCGKMLPGLLLVKGFERARDTSRSMAARRPAAARFDGRVGGGERQSVVCDGAKEENAP